MHWFTFCAMAGSVMPHVKIPAAAKDNIFFLMADP
jgi:hypothetical protein